MSQTETIEGGGGSGGTSGDGGGVTTLVIDTSVIRRVARNVVLGLVPSWIIAAEAFQSASSFEAWLREFVLRTITQWVVVNVVEPIVGAVIGLGELLIEAVLLVAFGADRAVGGSPGLADGIIFIANAVVAGTAPAATAIIDTIVGFNESIAEVAATAGFAAPVVVAGLATLEIVVVFYVVWSIIQIVDFPLVDVDDFLERTTEPFQAVLRRFR